MGKRIHVLVAFALVAALLALAACSGSSAGSKASSSAGSASASAGASASASASAASSEGKHIIGVAVYDVADSEVLMFKQYLMDYVAGVCFDDVQFVYSDSIMNEDDMMAFIDQVADMGGEGLMSFYNLDLQAEVARCAEHGMYHMVASGTVSDVDFASVASNDHFIGEIGPGPEVEYTIGGNMVRNYVANKVGNRYFILSGGAAAGNEMHYQRTFGMLDALETGYGVDLGATKDLAAVAEPTTITVEDLTVTICPGYVAIDEQRDAVLDAFENATYDVVLSTIPVAPIRPALDAANVHIAMVDCYSQDNQLLFESGKLNYLAGKYGSLVGPSAAAMYNAVTGHAADFRENGKAFKIVQSFWSSDSAADFNEKYAFASNITTPAYNYQDLQSVCADFNADASFERFKELAQASSFEDALKRRAQ